MPLGGGGLGTLTLFINADTSDFDQAVSRVENRAKAFGSRFSQVERGLDLTPNVDDSQLTALNKHLDLKQRHFQQVGQFMQRSPLEPKVRSSQLDELKAELKEVADLQRQTAKQFENNPINMPRITISPRINNRTINEAPRINTRITGPDLKVNATASPKVTVSNRLSNAIKTSTSAAKGASASPQQASNQLRQVENQVERLDQTEISPRLDIEAIERFTKRIAELEAQVDSLNEKTKKTSRNSEAGKAVLDATAKALPNAADKVATGIGAGISQGLSQAIPVFAGKMGDAAAHAVATGVAKAVTPAIKINTPEFKFQTSFTDIVRAGKELAGASTELKEAAKASNKKDNPIMGFIGRVGGSILTGIGQGVGGRISTGIVAGIENKLEIKFREAAEAAVVVLADGLEDALGFEFKAVGAFVKEKAPAVFSSDRASVKKSTSGNPGAGQPETTIENAISYLASQDDGAMKKDGKGFNKLDTRRGQELSAKIKAGNKLTQEEAKAALGMLKKYRKQLADAQQGSLPEWEKIENLYSSVAEAQTSPAQDEQERIMAQLEQLKAQLKSLDNAASPDQIQQQVESIKKAEVELQSIVTQKQQDLIDAMMSSREITMSVLKPIGREMNLPDINKPQKDGGYSKEQLIKEVVSRSDPDELRKRIPFVPVPVSPEVISEAESRASMSPEELKKSLAGKRNSIANAIGRNPGQKTGNELADINNVIEKEKQVINNLLSRDLSNSAKRHLKKQEKELAVMSGQLVNETMSGSTVTPQPKQETQSADIPDPWVDVDQLRSQTAATRGAFETIGDIIGAFVESLGEYANNIAVAFKKILGSIGGLFSGMNPFAQAESEPSQEQPFNPNGYKPKDVRESIPKDVEVKEKEKRRDYEFKTKSGKKVKVTVKEEAKNQSEVSFAIDGSFGNKSEGMSQKERDAASLKIFKILKHDAQTRPDGHQYRGVAYDLDGYGAARAHAYQKIGNFTRPERGIVGMSQYGVTQGGKIVPDEDRLKHQERHLSPEYIAKNVAASEERMKRERDRQKVRNQTASSSTSQASVAQLRSQAAVAKDALDILGQAINDFVGQLSEATQKAKLLFGDLIKGDWLNKQQEPDQSNDDYYADVLGKITDQAANRSGVKLQSGQTPKLEFNDEHLKRVGARAQYNLKDNKLIVSSDVKKFFDALRSGAVNLDKYEQEVKDVVHELRHAFQYDFGKLNQGSLMSGAKPGVLTPFAQTSQNAQNYGENEAKSSYYQQFAKQTGNSDAFLQVIRDTEADAENFAEQWKDLIHAAFTIDETSLESTATNAAHAFVESLLSLTHSKSKQTSAQQNFTVAQNRGVTGSVGANTKLKQGLDSVLEGFNQSFDIFKTFEHAISSAASQGSSDIDDMLNQIQSEISHIQGTIELHANEATKQGATHTVDFLDQLENQLDVEVENVEKFVAYVKRKTGGRADPALDAVQSKFNAQVSTIRGNIHQSRNEAAMQAGLIQPPNANQDPPKQLNKFQAALETIRKIAKNVREELKAINSGEDIKVRMVKGSAADLGIDLSEEQAQKIAQNGGAALHGLEKASGVAKSVVAKNWKDVFEELLDEIDEFTDHALDQFADFVEGIPGGNIFAKVIRGAKEFKGVILSFVGLQMAWHGLVEAKEWLDSFDEVFVDAAVGWERFEKLISFSSKTFNQAQQNIKFVRDEAVRLGTDLKQSMQGFSQLSASSIDTGLEGEGTKQLFKGVNQASSAYGLDAEGQNRVYTALSQMISKNTVSSEELKQQLGEVLPGSFQMAARAAGKTTQEFTALLETGQILAEDFLPKFAQQLSAETAAGVAGAASSAQGATNRFNNSLLELQVSLGKFGIDERNLFFNAMAKGMDFLAKNAVVVSYALGSVLAGAISVVWGAFTALVSRLAQAGASFLATRLGITSLGVAMKTLGASIKAAASSFVLLTVVLEGWAMFQAATKDSAGKSRDFADTMKGAFTETKRAIAEARGELEKFNSEEAKRTGKKEPGKVVKRGQDSVVDEAPLLNWVFKKELTTDSGWLDKLRFGARETVTGATNGLGTIFNPGAAIDAVRKNDRTLVPTYANKKFQDTKRATTEILQTSQQSADLSVGALNDKELQKVKQYDEQLRQIQIKRRGITQINPGDKEGLNNLKRQEDAILEQRGKSYKPLAAMQSTNQQSIQALESEIEVYKEKIADTESQLGTANNPREKKDIQARLDYYKKTLPQLETGLKKVQTAQDNLSKAIGESVDKFILLQKQLQNVADRLADTNDRIQTIGNSAKSELSQAVVRGEMTPGQAEARKQQIDQDILSEQLKRKKGAINEYKGLLYGADAQAILESRGVKDINEVGQAQLGTLAAKAKDGTPEKEVFTRLQDMKKMELEASDLQTQLDASKEQAAQQIREANKQISDYFRDISRQSAELALTTKEAQAQIALQQQKNKLKSALQGFQDNFFSSFVDSLIEGMDSLNEPILASIEKERDIQSADFAKQDRDRQTTDLYRSLPIQSQQVKLDFSGLDAAPIKELKTNLQESAKASKSVTEEAKGTGAAIADSAKEASGLQSNVAQVESDAKNVKSATDSVTSSLQDNVTKAQDVNTEIQNNKDAIDNNRTATEGVNDAITTQAQKMFESMAATEQTIGTTNNLKAAWDFVIAGVVDVTAKTWEWFKGLGQNVPFVNQFGDLIGGWGTKIQDLIGKTWEWLKGLGDNIPFLRQIGDTIHSWGQAVAESPVGQAVGGAWDAAKGWVGDRVNDAQNALGMGGGQYNNGKYTVISGGRSTGSADQVNAHHGGSAYYSKSFGGKTETFRNDGGTERLIKDIVLAQNGSQAANVPSAMSGILRLKSESQSGGYGNLAEVLDEQGKVIARMAHLTKFAAGLQSGQRVNYGQIVGTQGNTGHSRGTHLHVELPKEMWRTYYNDLKDGTFGVKGAEEQHHEGDGHDHSVNQGVGSSLNKGATGMLGSMGQAPAAKVSSVGAPKLGQGYDALNILGGQLAQNRYFNPSTPEGRGRLAIALGIGGSEAFEKNTTRRAFYTYRGGTGNRMQGFGQFDTNYHAAAISTPEKYQDFFGSTLAGERRLPNSQKGIGDYGAKVMQAVQSGEIKTGADLIKWMKKGKLGGTNWQGVDDGWVRNPGLADQLVQYLKGGLPTQTGGAMPVGAPQASGSPAPTTPQPIIAPVPFASLAGGQQYSGTSVDTSKLTAAQAESERIKQVQKQQALDKEKARVDEARVQGEQRQRQRLEQLRQGLMETDKDRISTNRQFTGLGLDAQIQTPDLEAARKKMGINETYDDLEKEITEKIRKTQAGRDQAALTIQKLSSPDYVPQPGQDIAKDVEAARQAVATADKYLGDLKKIQGELKGQRSDRLKFEEEQAAREKKVREDQEKLATENVDISVLEAQLQKSKDKQGRGIRDADVANIPKLEAEIAARREEAQLKQQMIELDDKLLKNKDNPTIVAELNKQKEGLQKRLGIVKETIDANRVYSQEVMKRENAKTAREAATAQSQAELETLKQQLAGLQQIAQLNPDAPGVDQIPKLEETIALKELELKLTNDLAAAEQERFDNKIDDAQYKKRVEEIQKENQLAKENVFIKRQQAEAQASIARARAALANREQDQEVGGAVTEALAKNIEYGRSQGDPIAMRFATQETQQKLGFEKQMIDLDELEASGKRTKEEIDALRQAYTKLNEISLDNLRVEQQRATEDKVMEISGRMMSSRNSVLGGKGDLLSSMGLDTQAKEYRKVAAVNEQKQSYAQESLNLERFIAQMQLSNEQALELRSNLSAVNEMKLDQIDQEFSTMNELMTGVQGSFESAFTSILDGSKSIGEAALDFLKGIGSQLAQMASKMITDELFGGLMGKGNKNKAKSDAEAIGSGGFLGGQGNPLSQYTMLNPLPVTVANASALGGGGLDSLAGAGMGDFKSSDSFLSGIFGGQSSFGAAGTFGESNPLPVNMIKANDDLFSSLTNGIMGIFGGSGGGSGIGGLLGGAMSIFGGGGGMGGGGGLGFLSAIPNLLGIFHAGGAIGDRVHMPTFADGGQASGLEENIVAAMQRERSMSGGREPVLIVANRDEFIVPASVAKRLDAREKSYLLGKSSAPQRSIANYSRGGMIGDAMGSSISNQVTNMGGSTKIEGSTVNVGNNSNMSKEEAARLKALIDSSVMDTIQKQRRPRGLLY